MKRAGLLTAALAAAVAVLALASLPPARLELSTASDDGTVSGVLHIHTNRSDGRSSPEVIAAAAARAGLKFIVLTDHGDGTRTPDPPTYRSGVLCLDALEISTNGGHYLALDMPAAPYPLGGDARDVVEDVARLGGFGIVAHPDSPKYELRWREWGVPFDGMEIVNPDTSWRVLAGRNWRSRLRLLDALLTYAVRPPETIASLLVDVPETFLHWNRLVRERRIVATSGTDAHAMLGWGDLDPEGHVSLPLPGYEASFRTASIHVTPSRPLTGDPASDSSAIMNGIRRGHLYSAIDGLATPPLFTFTARNQRGSAAEGDELAAGGPVELQVRSNAGEGFTTTIWQDDHVLKSGTGQTLTATAAEHAASYTVDIRAKEPNRSFWLISNPIYVGRSAVVRGPAVVPPALETYALFEGEPWLVEADASSQGAVEAIPRGAGRELRFKYTLSSSGPFDSYSGIRLAFPRGLPAHDRLSLSGRSDRPVRVSLQFRTGSERPPEERWKRSVYLDNTSREQTIDLRQLRPVGPVQSQTPPFADFRFLLIVVDRTNTRPGSSGQISITRAALEKTN